MIELRHYRTPKGSKVTISPGKVSIRPRRQAEGLCPACGVFVADKDTKPKLMAACRHCGEQGPFSLERVA